MRTVVAVAGAVALASGSFGGTTSGAAPRFTIRAIDGIGGAESLALGVNDHGQVVGQFVRENGSLGAYIWSSSGGMVELQGLTGTSDTAAFNLNNRGQVVGYGMRADGQTEALLWQPDGQMVNVGQVWDASGGTEVFDINEQGMMVGSRRVAAGQRQGLMYTVGGDIVNVGTIEGNNQSKNTAINEDGDVAGFSYRLFQPDRAAVTHYTGDAYEPTVDLGPTGRTFSRAFDLNDLGQVVGFANDGASAIRAAIFDTDRPGGWTNLGIVEGYGFEESEALSINNSGWIVGRSFNFENSAATFYFGGEAIELSTLVDNLSADGFIALYEANAVNDLGQIVGSGMLKDGSTSGFILTVVPAPGAVGALGLAGVFGVRRRR